MDYNLLLDDSRDIQMVYNITGNQIYNEKEWIIVKSFDAFVQKIVKYYLPINISFDHDISDFITENGETKERTGYDCVKWLVDYCVENNKKLPNCLVHSSNIVGRNNIISYLNNAKKHLNL
jgi:hypothetical protein